MSFAQDIVNEAINEVNNDPSIEVKIEKDPNFLLLDHASKIDSLTLVNLFVGIEALIENRFDKNISLVNEESFESDQYPFKTVGSLINYVQNLLDQ